MQRVDLTVSHRPGPCKPIFPPPPPREVRVHTFDAGCIVEQFRPIRPMSRRGRKAPVGGRRGAVVGFSASSRARLRERIVTASFTGADVYGLTLTFPGIKLPSDDAVSLAWDRWRKAVSRLGCYVIWRKEIQRRGAIHWHCLLWADRRLAVRCRDLWWDSIDAMGPYIGPIRLSGGDVVEGRASSRMALPGAIEHAVGFERIGPDRARALRYLCDHTSKSKQEQSKTTGRAWGEICRSARRESDEGVAELHPAALDLFVRLCRRLYAYSVRANCVFGYRIERRSNRRLKWHGKHVLMGRPEAVRRLVQWCNTTALRGVVNRP